MSEVGFVNKTSNSFVKLVTKHSTSVIKTFYELFIVAMRSELCTVSGEFGDLESLCTVHCKSETV